MHSCVCLFACGRALYSPGWCWALYFAVSILLYFCVLHSYYFKSLSVYNFNACNTEKPTQNLSAPVNCSNGVLLLKLIFLSETVANIRWRFSVSLLLLLNSVSIDALLRTFPHNLSFNGHIPRRCMTLIPVLQWGTGWCRICLWRAITTIG